MMSDVRFLIDLTTSREYKGRNAVGIVRTEREIGKALLAAQCPVDFFRFDTTTRTLLKIPQGEATAILGKIDEIPETLPRRQPMLLVEAAPPETADDGELRVFLKQVQDRLANRVVSQELIPVFQPDAEEALELFSGDVVISAGLLWDGNFLELLYLEKQRINLSVIQIVYDIVPILMPEFCVPGMNIRFPKYLLDAAWTADAMYCISESTLHDVENYLMAHKLPMPALHRIELGVDQTKEHAGSTALRNTLDAGEFIVYVSTIEPRKNHAMLFHIWRQLYQTDRDVLVPLVIVGRHGWNSSDLILMIQAAEHLHPRYIKIMTEVSDDDLDWLYRNSRFTVYPSLYEGWGLPVAESLARGKFCIAADTSSIPEAAAGFADLIDPLDLVSWRNKINHYLHRPDLVKARESQIKQDYKSMSWKAAMDQFVVSVISNAQPTQTLATAACTSANP